MGQRYAFLPAVPPCSSIPNLSTSYGVAAYPSSVRTIASQYTGSSYRPPRSSIPNISTGSSTAICIYPTSPERGV
eukprot:1787835-Rhodomonas_salina.3